MASNESNVCPLWKTVYFLRLGCYLVIWNATRDSSDVVAPARIESCDNILSFSHFNHKVRSWNNGIRWMPCYVPWTWLFHYMETLSTLMAKYETIVYSEPSEIRLDQFLHQIKLALFSTFYYSLYVKIYLKIFTYHTKSKIAWTWWRHQMETCSALLAIYAENSLVPGEFPAQRPLARSFDAFFDLRLNKRLSKQSLGW